MPGVLDREICEDVVARNHVAVSHLLVKGYNPNANHLGAMPLSLAVENGDIDMAAMLLNAKADPDTKALANLPSARKMAEDMAKDSKCKYQSEAKQIVAIINDPILMAQRLALLHERLEKTKALDKKRAMNLFLVVIVMAIFYGIFYFFLGKTGAGQRFLQRDHEL